MTVLFAKPFPLWGKLAGGVSLLWNLFGDWSFYSQYTMSAAAMAALPPEQQEIWKAMPGWLWLVYALAVLSGTAGAVGLLMRKSWAKPLFHFSIVAVILQFGTIFATTPIIKTVGPSSIILPAVIITAAILQWWLARDWVRKAWLT